MLRPLTPTEAMLWWLDRAASLNFTTVARIEGPLTEAALRAGLDALRARHPALRVRIVDGAFHACDAPVPLRVGARDLTTELEAELAESFAWDRGPLARCVWLPDSGHVLLTFQHCISDGHSGIHAMRDLLAAAATHLRGTTPRLEVLPMHVAADHRLPRTVRRFRYWLSILAFAARTAWQLVWLRRPTLAADAHVNPGDRTTRVFTAVFDADVTTRLLERSRAERTTVHGVLGAVHMQATAADAGNPVVQYATPVDLRPHLDPPLGDEVGYYVGASNARFRVDPDAPPWPLARRLRATVKHDVASGVCMVLNRFGPPLLRFFTRDGARPEGVADRLYAIRGSTGMTNLGRVTLDADLTPLRPTELYFVVALSALGDQVATATCFDGRIFWSYCVGDPTVSPERARRVWADVVARIEAL